MSRYMRIIRRFDGGLSELGSEGMSEGELVQAQNAEPRGGGIARAAGTAPVWTQLPGEDGAEYVDDMLRLILSSGIARNLFFVQRSDGSQDLLRLNGRSWDTVASGMRAMLDRFIFGGKLYWLDGEGISCYDGSSVAAAQQTPLDGSAVTAAEAALWARVVRSRAVEQRGQRWFYAIGGNDIAFSELGDPCCFAPTSVISVGTRDDDSITALREFNNGLLIFKRRSVYYLSGWDLQQGSDIALTQLNVSSGTNYPRTVAVLEKGVFYLGGNGIYRLYIPSGALAVAAQNISQQRISRALFRDGEPERAIAAVYDNSYRICVSNAGSEAREYRYYPQQDAFFGPFTQQPTCYAQWSDGRLYMGIPQRRIVAQDEGSRHYIDPESGGSVPIEVIVQTRELDLSGRMAQFVRLKQLLLVLQRQHGEELQLQLGLRLDGEELAYTLAIPADGGDDAGGDDAGGDDAGGDDAGGDDAGGDDAGGGAGGIDGGGAGEGLPWQGEDSVTEEIWLNRRVRRAGVMLRDAALDRELLLYGTVLVYKPRRISGRRDCTLGTPQEQ